MDENKPGDVVNGHVLGNDRQWHPISAPPEQQYLRLDPSSYWAKWLRRWVKSWLGVSAAAVVLMLIGNGGQEPGVLSIFFAFIAIGVPVGTAVNFLVAAI